MGYALAVYGNNAFEEFLLPQVNDQDHSITLTAATYGLQEDVVLGFANIDGVWIFKSLSANATLRSTGLRIGAELTRGSLIHVRQDEATVGAVVMQVEQKLDRFKKYIISKPCKLQIGSAEGNHIVYDFEKLISRTHAVLDLSTSKCRIIDNSRNGIYMDGKRINAEQDLAFGDKVNIFGLQIIWLGNVLAISNNGLPMKVWAPELQELTESKQLFPSGVRNIKSVGKRLFHRSPRLLPKLNTDPIEIEAVPQPNRTTKRPLILTIGPSFTMVIPMLLGTLLTLIVASSNDQGMSPYMYTGIVIAAASAGIGVMWALLNLKYSKRAELEAEENRINRYQNYLMGIEEEIYAKYAENKRVLDNAYPSAADCAQYDAYCPMLWNRNLSHSDMLFVRLGKGSIPFQCPIVIPKKKFTLHDDELSEQPAMIRDKYQVLPDVPVGIDLRKHRLVGIAGNGGIESAAAIARTMAIQIAANCCYTDVKMAFLCEEGMLDQGAWRFAKWLPHVWSESKSSRYCAQTQTEINEVCFNLSEIIRARVERLEAESDEELIRPHYIIFIEDLELLGNEGLVKYLLSPKEEYGITTVIMAARRELLPNECENIIECNGSHGSIYNLAVGVSGRTEMTLDVLSARRAERFARTVSGIEVSEIESSGAIPEAITFLDMWGVKTLEELNVTDRWRKNRTYDSMRALIGQKAGGQDWHLDIHEKHHGPHGLIAGTTGSGKSETLQTYMLSLAVNYSPDDVVFFVIDYKGGGMANLFSNLPHMAGQISNLSGNQVNRAMVSIISENRRRQRLFNECGVNHIDNYTRLYKNGEAPVPLPHLLIIIDEFAELKKEESSFMRELISVAQVGRSLGVHLILATQKPSGTVDDNIWSNAKFRLCLRVQDRKDSNEMLHKPDAAYITQAGRGFMQVGNDEIFEEFQSGWSGADYDEALVDIKANVASMRTNTGKSAIIGNHTKKLRKDKQRILWLQQLSGFFFQGAREQNASLSQIVSDREQMRSLIERVYAKIDKAEIDYAMNKANTERLQEYALVLSKHSEEELQTEKQMRQLILSMQKENVKLPEIKSKTQLSAVVDHLGKIAKDNGYTNAFRLWLPVLPEQLHLQNLAGYKDGCFDGKTWRSESRSYHLDAIIGLSDNPANQVQLPFSVSLSENGSLAVCGSSGSGKTTFLQTLLFSLVDHYSPASLNFYILDFSNRSLAVFDNLAHCGGVVFEDDPEKLARFFNMLTDLIRKRKEILRGGTYSQYVKLNGPKIPAVLIVIDNYASFKEKTDGIYESKLASISREGANYGIYLVISAGGFGGTEITNRVAENLRNVVCLELGDKYKYGDVLHTMHFDVLPEAGVTGRGIAPMNGGILEYQTALPLEAKDDYERAEKMQAYFEKMNKAWSGKLPRRIPEIPENPTLEGLGKSEEYQLAIADPRYLPYGYMLEDASISSIDFAETFCWLITGKPRSGKSTLLQLLLAAAKQKKAQICVTDFGAGRLRKSAQEAEATYVTNAEELFEFTRAFQQSFLQRNAKKREMLLAGAEEDEVFAQMQKEQPIILLIDDLAGFVQTVYQAGGVQGSMRGFYENAIEKGALHNIYVIACVDTENTTPLLGKKVYEKMAAYKTGIHLGGNVAGQKVLNFASMPFSEQTKQTKPGLGLLPQDIEHSNVRKVVIPKLRR
ncbi:MAG: FHA domain-containing protein [Ruminococcaceae bacterium]|nr:FHA domain-containing protein [Oscillospiraceae bacterium]